MTGFRRPTFRKTVTRSRPACSTLVQGDSARPRPGHCEKEAVVRRVRPGAAVSRGGGTSPGVGEERALTSVTAAGPYDGQASGQRSGQPSGLREPTDVPRLWHVTLSVSGGEAPLTEVRRGLEQLAH